MRVEPEGRVVLAVLGELARLVDDLRVLGSSPLVRFTHDGDSVILATSLTTEQLQQLPEYQPR